MNFWSLIILERLGWDLKKTRSKLYHHCNGGKYNAYFTGESSNESSKSRIWLGGLLDCPAGGSDMMMIMTTMMMAGGFAFQRVLL